MSYPPHQDGKEKHKGPDPSLENRRGEMWTTAGRRIVKQLFFFSS